VPTFIDRCRAWLSALQLGLDRRDRSAFRDAATFAAQSLDPSRESGTLGHGAGACRGRVRNVERGKADRAISATANVMVRNAQATVAAMRRDVGTMERILGRDWHLPRIRQHNIEQNRTVAHPGRRRWAPLLRRGAMTNYPVRRGATRTPLRAIESPMPNGTRSLAAASQCNFNGVRNFTKIALESAPLPGQARLTDCAMMKECR
jgi:hypothetical protein